jgi:hypothetical protein
VFLRFEQPERLLFFCKATYVRDKFRDDWAVTETDKDSLQKSMDLASEEVHFYSRGLDSQRAILEEFISSCLSQTTYEVAQQEAD